jgi:hypothetical protein
MSHYSVYKNRFLFEENHCLCLYEGLVCVQTGFYGKKTIVYVI